MREPGVPWDPRLFLSNALQSENGTQLVIKHVDKLFLINSVSGGIVEMNDRTMNGSFNNSRVNGNIAVQSDSNTQIQGKLEDFERAYKDLLGEIKELEGSNKEQAMYLAEDLKASFDSGDKNKGQRILGLMGNILGSVGSLASIASLFGVVLK